MWHRDGPTLVVIGQNGHLFGGVPVKMTSSQNTVFSRGKSDSGQIFRIVEFYPC